MVYEPVAYDKSIYLDEGRFQPIVRMDGAELKLPAFAALEDAQTSLSFFSPDVWEGDGVPWSINCHPDKRGNNENEN